MSGVDGHGHSTTAPAAAASAITYDRVTINSARTAMGAEGSIKPGGGQQKSAEQQNSEGARIEGQKRYW
ncbi:MAG: hypothetical protein AAFV29_10645, partial [Myxococcota bacterium]